MIGVKALETILFTPTKRMLDIIQMSLFGQIYPDITFEFDPLSELDSEKVANENYINAQTDQMYYNMGVKTSSDIKEGL
jgi:hypothetical protein